MNSQTIKPSGASARCSSLRSIQLFSKHLCLALAQDDYNETAQVLAVPMDEAVNDDVSEGDDNEAHAPVLQELLEAVVANGNDEPKQKRQRVDTPDEMLIAEIGDRLNRMSAQESSNAYIIGDYLAEGFRQDELADKTKLLELSDILDVTLPESTAESGDDGSRQINELWRE